MMWFDDYGFLSFSESLLQLRKLAFLNRMPKKALNIFWGWMLAWIQSVSYHPRWVVWGGSLGVNSAMQGCWAIDVSRQCWLETSVKAALVGVGLGAWCWQAGRDEESSLNSRSKKVAFVHCGWSVNLGKVFIVGDKTGKVKVRTV